MSHSSNKKIAISTFYMYARLLVTMVIGLYTSRVVLLILGISDYGLFNIVGGVLTLFTFITGSLGAATSRFLNAEMGNPHGNVNKVYNINQILHFIFSGLFFIIAETIGLWYIYNKLVVAPDKLHDALFVFQISVITTCIGVVNTPCTSIFTAKEKFGFQATVDIINNVIRLLCIFALQYYNGNSLRMYTLIMCMTTINSFFIYHWFARKWWPEIIKTSFIKGWINYKPILSFGSWNLLTTASIMARNSGSDLIINLFYGTATNGIFAISKTISAQVITFSANFDGASAPQIIQSYNAGDMNRCIYLVNKMGRFSLLLFEIVLFPLWIELDFILHLWLKVVPEGVLLLCKLNLVLAAVSLSCGGIIHLINASGKIKWFNIEMSIFYWACIPVGYAMFKLGFPSYSMMILFIVADICLRIAQLFLLFKLLGFDSLGYVRTAYFRPLIIALIMGYLIYLYTFLNVQLLVFKLLAIVSCGFIVIIFVYYYGLTSNERRKVLELVYRKFRIYKC